MGRKQSMRSKAAHFVSDLTTVFLNPISDKPSKPQPNSPSPVSVDETESKRNQLEPNGDEGSEDLVVGPDTSSFSAFLYSLLSSAESGDNTNSDDQVDEKVEQANPPPNSSMKENGGRRSLFSKGKQTLGRVVNQAARFSGYRNQQGKGDSDLKIDGNNNANTSYSGGVEMRHIQKVNDPESSSDLPGVSEPSLLLSENTRTALYASLPALVQGRKWFLLYSTWRHGISLSTLYRRSMLWPGLSLLVVGDRKGAVFGGLVEAPLNPTNKKKYQGTNATFVFTDKPGHPVIFHPTGANRYFTLCSLDFLAIGGGGHFALYLDNDLLNGSSSVSETYGNPCLAHSEDFEVKEIEFFPMQCSYGVLCIHQSTMR
ncbi:uncharacterized protein LOC133805288 isoform X2 [Humulus lupulus]|uniref:uncharacterized protein LOC133805288 isoform X2 n=1 Tax=Humulus lupulus TaxID=3486 RepID=UPI002B4125BB|nr:uncharacterized protein LOC133805288 isoform X2 [Humulus lupulus]